MVSKTFLVAQAKHAMTRFKPKKKQGGVFVATVYRQIHTLCYFSLGKLNWHLLPSRTLNSCFLVFSDLYIAHFTNPARESIHMGSHNFVMFCTT
eukprot:UN24675